MNKTLVAGPFCGELGWELVSWQPMLRNLFLSSSYEQCFVYTRPGRDLLYRFATVRPIDFPPHEAECMVWHNMPDHADELNAIIKKMVDGARAEFGEDVGIFSYGSLPALNQELYERGRPDLLGVNVDMGDLLPEVVGKINKENKTIVLCVRDREMSDFRNTDYGFWFDLAEDQVKERNVIVVGKIRKPDEWTMPEGVIDLTNKTTIDDCIRIFANWCDLAVGTTGTIHLASRCGCDHLVWGNEKTVIRCAETCWFGSLHKVYPIGWDPEPDTIAAFIEHFFDKGAFA